jgi:uncharacterized membrane protein YhaH (DUF805 family)
MTKYCAVCGTPAMANMLRCTRCRSTDWSDSPPSVQHSPSTSARQAQGQPTSTTTPINASLKHAQGPVAAVNVAMRKTFTFSGRASRSEYWYFFLFFYISIIGLSVLIGWGQNRYGDGSPLLIFLSIVLIVFFVWITIANLSLQVRRLHDIGKSGYWILLILIPLLSLALLMMSFRRGTIGPNLYGDEPEYF